MAEKAIVLYSGGLDSRLVVKILHDQGLEVEALFFNLPFGCGCCNLSCNFKFTQMERVKMKIFDVTKNPYLPEYLETIKEAKHGRGTAYNACKDCKIYIYRKAKEYAKEHNIKIIATGEVMGQRPMSQVKSAMKIIDEDLDFEILRPLSAKLLEETQVEKDGLVDRSKFYAIQGRGRKKQMELAKEFDIEFPSPGGGCLLCEKVLKNRFETLVGGDLITEDNLPLVPVGRHFMKDDAWYIVARNANECEVLDRFTENTLVGESGTPSIYTNKGTQEFCLELQQAFSKNGTDAMKKQCETYKL
jgi:tRNA-specific 2-thiouridylase